MVVYGIKNCNSVQKALSWLDENHFKYEFHDFKKLGISPDKLKEWSDQVGYEALLNKRGTTWKKLDSETQSAVTSAEAAFRLMEEKTSVIKRPVLEKEGKIILGFDPEAMKEFVK